MAKPANTTPPLPYPVSHKSLDNLARFDQDLTKALHYYLIDIARRANIGLARDGTEPMEGSLDMGGFNISNIGNITITGTVTLTSPLPIAQGGTASTTASAARTALDVPGLTTPNVFTKTQTWAKGADVASAATLTLGTDGNYFDITGTTAITSIGTLGVGTTVKLHFDGILTLTHHATDLILPGGANITTAAGDEAEFVEYATGDWRCTNYQPYARPVIITPWVAYTPTINGLGTPTFVRFRSRRVGANLEVDAAFTSGTGTAETVTISLGYNGVNITGLAISSYWNGYRKHFGTAQWSYTTPNFVAVLGLGGEAFVTLGLAGSGGSGGTTPVLGSGLSGITFSLMFSVPIEGWN